MEFAFLVKYRLSNPNRKLSENYHQPIQISASNLSRNTDRERDLAWESLACHPLCSPSFKRSRLYVTANMRGLSVQGF